MTQSNGQQLAAPAYDVASKIALSFLKDAQKASKYILKHASIVPEQDELHDFRVDIRRFRSFYDSYDQCLTEIPKKQQKKVKRLFKSTNLSRDYEVVIQWLEQLQDERISHASSKNFDRLLGYLRHTLEGEYKTVRQNTTADFVDLSRKIKKRLNQQEITEEIIENSFGYQTGVLLGPILEHVNSAIVHAWQEKSDESFHSVRKSLKGLRYVIDNLVNDESEDSQLLDKLKKAQDQLGDWHDRKIVVDHLKELLTDDTHRTKAERSLLQKTCKEIELLVNIAQDERQKMALVINDNNCKTSLLHILQLSKHFMNKLLHTGNPRNAGKEMKNVHNK